MPNIKHPSDELLDRLQAIDWLSNCQEDVELELPFEYRQVDSKHECESAVKSDVWTQISLEAQNRITEYLDFHHTFEYNRFWNDTADWVKDFYSENLAFEIKEVKSEYEFDDDFVVSVRRDILRTCMEDAFKKYNIPIFFHHLLEVYEAGLFPCGWEGGWPEENGTLLIY